MSGIYIYIFFKGLPLRVASQVSLLYASVRARAREVSSHIFFSAGVMNWEKKSASHIFFFPWEQTPSQRVFRKYIYNTYGVERARKLRPTHTRTSSACARRVTMFMEFYPAFHPVCVCVYVCIDCARTCVTYSCYAARFISRHIVHYVYNIARHQYAGIRAYDMYYTNNTIGDEEEEEEEKEEEQQQRDLFHRSIDLHILRYSRRNARPDVSHGKKKETDTM